MRSIIDETVKLYGATYTFDYRSNIPPVINDLNITSLLEDSTRILLGEESVYKLSEPSMSGEDFSCYLQHVPGALFFVGTHNKEKGIVHPIHHPKFDIDEDILDKASAVFARAAIDYLNSEQ